MSYCEFVAQWLEHLVTCVKGRGLEALSLKVTNISAHLGFSNQITKIEFR